MTDPVFFPPARRISLAEIAELTGSALADTTQGAMEISSVASASDARLGQICYLDGKGAAKLAERLRASAVFCGSEIADKIPQQVARLVTGRPQQAFALLTRVLYPEANVPQPLFDRRGVSPAAHIAPDAFIEDGAVVEPGAAIGPKATIGAGAVISANAVIGRSCQIGRKTYIGPGASIQAAFIGDRVVIHAGVRIGCDGFGFVAGRSGLEKIPQIGRVIIQDNVEIGANTTIDRGALSDTIIGDGTKIDNLVQIGHGVTIGRSCAIAAATGISGSVHIGDFVMIGGGAGLADHVTIGDGVQLAARSGVMHDIPAGEKWGGTPAQPVKGWLREVALLRDMSKSRNRK